MMEEHHGVQLAEFRHHAHIVTINVTGPTLKRFMMASFIQQVMIMETSHVIMEEQVGQLFHMQNITLAH